MNLIISAAFVIGIGAFVAAIVRDIGLGMILNTDALCIVLGGTFVALIVGFPLKRIREAASLVFDSFKKERDREAVIQDIVEIAKLYRKADIRGLEGRMKGMKDDFMRLGVNLLINHHRNEDIRSIMEREMALRIVHFHSSQNILKTMSRLTPSLGLAGTVISLIKMFKHLQSVETIAPLMAVALMSTFYGVILSNLVVLPLTSKIKDRAIISEALMQVSIEGMVAANNMDHPLRIEERLIGCRELGEVFSSESGSLSMTKSASRA